MYTKQKTPSFQNIALIGIPSSDLVPVENLIGKYENIGTVKYSEHNEIQIVAIECKC